MILLLYFFVKRHLVILKKKIEIDNRQFLIDVNASQHSAFSNLLGHFFFLLVIYHYLQEKINYRFNSIFIFIWPLDHILLTNFKVSMMILEPSINIFY